MSYTMADYRRDTVKEYFKELTPDELREFFRGLKFEFLRGLSLEERLCGPIGRRNYCIPEETEIRAPFAEGQTASQTLT